MLSSMQANTNKTERKYSYRLKPDNYIMSEKHENSIKNWIQQVL